MEYIRRLVITREGPLAEFWRAVYHLNSGEALLLLENTQIVKRDRCVTYEWPKGSAIAPILW